MSRMTPDYVVSIHPCPDGDGSAHGEIWMGSRIGCSTRGFKTALLPKRTAIQGCAPSLCPGNGRSGRSGLSSKYLGQRRGFNALRRS